MRVTFLPRNIDGSGMYRCWFPAIALEARGVFLRSPAMAFYSAGGDQLPLVNGQLPDGWVNCVFGEWPDADVFVFQMPLDANTPSAVGQLQAQGRKVVVELDDDFLHLPPYNPFERSVLGGAKNLHKAVQLADAVSVSTPSLAAAYRHLNKNVAVLQNRLHWPMWESVTPVYEQSWRRTRVGWMGLLDYHTADLEVIRPWFSKWLRANPDVEFVAAGDPRVHDFLGVPESQRVSTDRVDFRHQELPFVTAAFDVGLVPLAKNRFNEGKSYLKGLEYSACGIVPVASPTEQYRSFVREGVDGHLCDSRQAWIHALDRLVDRAAGRAWRQMGVAAREKASRWTYTEHVDEWVSFYERLAPKKFLWGDGDNAVAARAELVAG